MRSASIVSSISALIVAGAFFACATGGPDNATGDTGDGTGTDTDSGATTDPSTDDSGAGGFVAPKDAGGGGGTTKKDSGTTGGGTDSGSTSGMDSGSTMMMGTNDDCTGTQSAALKESYSKACTQTVNGIPGGYNWGSCTSGNGDCTAIAAKNPQLPGPLCCYTPSSNSTCDLLFGPSCLPK